MSPEAILVPRLPSFWCPDLSPSVDLMTARAHDLPVAGGRWLRLYESASTGAMARRPRRAVIMVSSFTAAGWTIPCSGYDAGQILADHGFLAFSVDLIGYGGSSRPANGKDATFAVQVEALATAIEFICSTWSVATIDVLGKGYGAGLAVRLAAAPERVRSVLLTDNVYRLQSGGPLASVEFRQQVLAAPNGYFFMPPPAIEPFLGDSPPEVASYFSASQSGLLPIASLTVAFDLPFYDPSAARAPGLVVQAEHDLVSPASDAAALAADFGEEGARFVVLEGAPRGARFASRSHADAYWRVVLGFLDSLSS